MEIRRADRGDQVAIGNLIYPWDLENGQRYQHGRGRVSDREFVAEDADGIVGWISGEHDAKVWQFLAAYEDQPDSWVCSQIVKVFVQKERRSDGIGADLLAVFERDAQDFGRDLVVLSPDEKGEKERLLSFYREHRYEFMDPCSDYSTRLPWFMAKCLPVLR